MPTPPTQPASGPGGSTLPWSGTSITARTLFPDQKSYWIISPVGYVGPAPAPTILPLVVFLHGYSFNANLNTPSGYLSWINHIARQGNVVVFPKYQNSFDLNSSNWTPNAIASVKDALSKPWPSIAADPAPGMLLVAHSAGGLVAANMANRYVANGLPTPKGMVLAMPYQDAGLDAAPMSGIPATTKLLCVVGNADTNVGRSGADAIFDRTNHLTERSYVRMSSDSHGSPVLTADHHVSEESSGVGALDFNGLWKFSDAMADYVFRGANSSYVFGGGPDQTSLGNWSDGVPVIPMTVTPGKP